MKLHFLQRVLTLHEIVIGQPKLCSHLSSTAQMDFIFCLDASYTDVNRNVAINAVLNEFKSTRIGPNDTLTVLTFDDSVHVIHDKEPYEQTQREPLAPLNFFKTEYKGRCSYAALFHAISNRQRTLSRTTQIVLITDGHDDKTAFNIPTIEQQLAVGIYSLINVHRGRIYVLILSDDFNKDSAINATSCFTKLRTESNKEGYKVFQCQPVYSALLQCFHSLFAEIPVTRQPFSLTTNPYAPNERLAPSPLRTLPNITIHSPIDKQTEEYVLKQIIAILNQCDNYEATLNHIGSSFKKMDKQGKGIREYIKGKAKDFLMKHSDKFDLSMDLGNERIKLLPHLVVQQESVEVLPSENVNQIQLKDEMLEKTEREQVPMLAQIDETVRDIAYSLLSNADLDLLMCKSMLERQREELLSVFFTHATLLEMQRNITERIDHLVVQIAVLQKGGQIEKSYVRQTMPTFQRTLEGSYDKLKDHYETEQYCVLCKHNYKEQRVRPCGHVFCNGCVEILLVDNNCCVCNKPFHYYEKV
jgi:hypothetical protein